MAKTVVRATGRDVLLSSLLLGVLLGPAPAADTSGGSPDQPGHEMGGNDSKPGFFDIGKGGKPDVKNPLPAPGKAAGASTSNSPPPPAR